jgi:hypothetical protein
MPNKILYGAHDELGERYAVTVAEHGKPPAPISLSKQQPAYLLGQAARLRHVF